MNRAKLEFLNELKESFQAQLLNITVAEKALEENFIRSEKVYNHNRQNNVCDEQILESLKMTLEFNKQKLDKFRRSSNDTEKKYKALLTMVEKSINELTSI